MTTATRSVAVVATRLPDIDRRTLSQAWYSALHVAQPPAPRALHHNASSPCAANPRHASPCGTARVDRDPRADRPTTLRPVAVRTAPTTTLAAERRGTVSELARRIERAIARHIVPGPVRSAAVAIDAPNGRVHLLVRTDGATTRIVALCAPHLRERVDRALAQARFALAASGTRVEVAR